MNVDNWPAQGPCRRRRGPGEQKARLVLAAVGSRGYGWKAGRIHPAEIKREHSRSASADSYIRSTRRNPELSRKGVLSCWDSLAALR